MDEGLCFEVSAQPLPGKEKSHDHPIIVRLMRKALEHG